MQLAGWRRRKPNFDSHHIPAFAKREGLAAGGGVVKPPPMALILNITGS